jgi:alanine dehydrogenase
MSQIAGRLSIQEGAKYIESSYGGRGILLGGVPGVERGKIVIIGGGIAGTYAAKAAVGTRPTIRHSVSSRESTERKIDLFISASCREIKSPYPNNRKRRTAVFCHFRHYITLRSRKQPIGDNKKAVDAKHPPL